MQNADGTQPMTYLILARDGTSQIVLKRDSEDAAEKKADRKSVV